MPNYIQSTPQLFADDTCLLISEITPKKLQSELNKDITSIYNWLNSNKLILNTLKLQIMIISLKLNSLMLQLNVNCYTGSIKLATKVKYLGVKIDNKLDFKYNRNPVETKISTSVDILGKFKN